MKNTITDMLQAALRKAAQDGLLADTVDFTPLVERPKVEAHGDFSTNMAMVLAKSQKMAPRKLAQVLCSCMDDPDNILGATEIAGPGFINFRLRPEAWERVLDKLDRAGPDYGRSNLGGGQKVQVEFVSANPTGPLHVGHGRGAAVGDALASILEFTGFDVQKEYYINDSGRQIRTLGLSVYLRFLELEGSEADFPEDAYQGEYIRDLARRVRDEKLAPLLDMDKAEAVDWCARFAASEILAGIKKDLEDFGVSYDCWFSEQSLYDSGTVERILAECEQKDLVYEAQGAKWFRTSAFGDEKDRVVVRANGLSTYFASDIAYHHNKFQRGFERVIDIWGADHHGYVKRVSAAIQALGHPAESFSALLVKLVNLVRAGEPVAMSTRAGEFVTLADVLAEVGRDAARFIFLSRSHEAPLDFDLELAKSQTAENPVYYVQYVHARVASIEKKAAQEGRQDLPGRGLLTTKEEIRLLKKLAEFPETVAQAAATRQAHKVAYFLMELAGLFHPFYNKHRVLGEDARLSAARLRLVRGVRQVIQNGLRLLGVRAPESM